MPDMARRLRVSDQTLKRAVDSGEIPSTRNERDFRIVRRSDIPDEWVRKVHRRRQARWGDGDEPQPEGEPQAEQSEVGFLREQIRVKDETISRLVRLLEQRSS